MSDWQPISSAPRDGHKILVQPNDHRELPFIGYWAHVGRYTSSPMMWLGHDYGAMTDRDITHWMPLPEPPASADRSPKGQDREAGLDAQHESAVPEGETPK